MPSSVIQVLLVEDSPSDFLLLRNALETDPLEPFVLTRAEKLGEAFGLLESATFDIVLLDLDLPDSHGLETFERLQRHSPGLPVVVCSGNPDVGNAIQAVRNGAQDYLVKSLGGFEMAARTTRYAVERHKLLKSLQQSEIRFAAIFENSPVAIGISRLRDGKIVHVNAAFTGMFGYSRAECIGRTTAELGIWADLNVRQRFLELLTNQHHVHDFDAVARRRSGETRSALVSGELMEIDNEPCFVAQIVDITERKLAEGSLRASQESLRLVLETTSDGFWIVDSARRFLDVNQAYCGMSGYTREELLRMSIPDVDVNESRQDTDHHIQKIIQDGHDRFETRHRRKDGSVFDVEVSVNVMDPANGVMICFCRDNTERKAAEQAIQRHNEQLTTVVKIEHDLAAALDEYLIHGILSQGIQQLYPDVSTLFISRYDSERGMIRAVYGLHEGTLVDVGSLPEIPLAPEGQGTQSKVIRSGQPLIISNHLKDNLRPSATTRIGSGEADTQSAVYVPMSAQNTVLGLIQLQSLLPGRFSAEDAQILSLIANTASVAIQNARLYELAQKEIAERKQIEATLRQSEEKYRKLSEELEERVRWRTAEIEAIHRRLELATQVTNLGVWDWNIGSGELFWDEQVYANYGLSKDTFQVSMESFLSIIYPEDVPSLMSFTQEALSGRMSGQVEYRVLRGDNTLGYIKVHGAILFDADGHPQNVIGVVQDVTQEKLAEQSLRESEEQNRLLFEEAPEAVILFDEDGQVARMNHASENLTGYQQVQLVGHTLSHKNLMSDGDMEQFAMAIVQTLQMTDEFASVEIKITRADGELRDVGVRVFGIKLLGRQHYLTTLRDITAEKKTGEALRLANAEMERSLRLKDEFLANMSHELRTPLNAILGISESLGEQVIGPLNDKQQKYIQTVLESGQHLLSLINDILDLAKINAGKIEMEMAGANLASVAESSLRMVRELAQKKGQSLNFKMDPALTRAWVDERRLKQMLVNLLSNAVKFTPQGGSIGLELRGDRQLDTLQFIVWDTGIGIHADDLPRLFRPFVQLDASLTRDAQGTGLGLVLVSQMARLHGGSVRVESEPGRGSCFTISIPWVAPPHTGTLNFSAPEPEASVPHGNGEARATILLVDDTESITMLMHDYLEHAGYKVNIAHNGLDAIAQAARIRPQLILMDVMMPEMDGLETVRNLRSLPHFKHIPIIALTALAMPNDRDRCFAAGMDDYLSKPVKLQNLVATIEKHLQNRREQAQ